MQRVAYTPIFPQIPGSIRTTGENPNRPRRTRKQGRRSFQAGVGPDKVNARRLPGHCIVVTASLASTGLGTENI